MATVPVEVVWAGQKVRYNGSEYLVVDFDYAAQLPVVYCYATRSLTMLPAGVDVEVVPKPTLDDVFRRLGCDVDGAEITMPDC